MLLGTLCRYARSVSDKLFWLSNDRWVLLSCENFSDYLIQPQYIKYVGLGHCVLRPFCDISCICQHIRADCLLPPSGFVHLSLSLSFCWLFCSELFISVGFLLYILYLLITWLVKCLELISCHSSCWFHSGQSQFSYRNGQMASSRTKEGKHLGLMLTT